MISKKLKLLSFAMVAATAHVFALRWPAHAIERTVLGLDERPYVYRMLVPALANLLHSFGVPIVTSFQVVFDLSAIGLTYALFYLLTAFRR